MAEITCEKCSRQYRVDRKFIGKKIRCKNCNHPIPITTPAPPLPHAFAMPRKAGSLLIHSPTAPC